MLGTLRYWMCKIGWHSEFRQWDKWGSAIVCRYCVHVKEN